MSDNKHEEVGKVHPFGDPLMRRLSDAAADEFEAMFQRYGMQFLFTLGVMRQRENESDDEDAEILGTALGCAHCTAYFLGQTALRNPRVGAILADAMQWAEKLRKDPEQSNNEFDLSSMPIPNKFKN